MSDIGTMIELLQETKKDIIKVVNARNETLETMISNLEETVKKQNSRIGKLEDKSGEMDDILKERGITCYQKLAELAPTQKTVKMINFFSSHKFITIALSLVVMTGIQAVVLFLFTRGEILEIIKLLYKL